MGHRRYTQKERDAAVSLYVEEGLPAAFKATGIPKPTILRWAKRVGIVSKHPEKVAAASAALTVRANAMRADLKVKLLERAAEMLERMGEKHLAVTKAGVLVEADKPPAAVCKDLAVTLGILIDKFRLESGEVTGREEVRHDHSDRTDEDLIREANEITRAASHRR